MSKVSARIEQLIKKWGTEDPKRRITGHRLHQQLCKEGYRVCSTTVYVYLSGRDLRARQFTARSQLS